MPSTFSTVLVRFRHNSAKKHDQQICQTVDESMHHQASSFKLQGCIGIIDQSITGHYLITKAQEYHPSRTSGRSAWKLPSGA